MITSNQEDYLKIIYDENLKQNKITNKHISDKLDIKAPSVTAMLNKLILEDYLIKDNKLGFILTNKGKEVTEELLSKHRLWELFLIEHLNYTWDEVHHDADQLEHVTSDQLLDKINTFLGKPTKCPHGKPIYINIKKEADSFGEILINQKINYKGKISVIEDNSELLLYLTDKNININDEFILISKNKLDQSLVLNINNTNITISNYAASKIFVK